jgi:hypothetical protein
MKTLTLLEYSSLGSALIGIQRPLEFPSVGKDDSIWLISDAAQTMNAELKII